MASLGLHGPARLVLAALLACNVVVLLAKPGPAAFASQESLAVAVSSPLTLSTSTVAPGGQVTATLALQNQSSSTINLSGIVIAARTPGGANADFGGIWGLSVGAGQTVLLQRSRTFTAADPAGTWTLFGSYETTDGVWHAVTPVQSLAVLGSTAASTSGGIALGATIKDNGTSVYPGSGLLGWYAGLVGRMPAIVNVGSDFVHSPNFDPTMMNYLVANGTMPMWTWMPEDDTQGAYQPSYTDKAVASGAFDGYIRQFAVAAQAWGHPFLLRFAHEMNGKWFPWSTGAGNPNGNSPADYVNMWRHVHDIFTSVGATNVRWVWSANTSASGFTPMAQDYPGDSYVDWVALDGYNRGSNTGQIWQSLATVFGASYQEASALGSRPMMLSEVASVEQGGSKADWITQGLLNTIPQSFPRIRAVVWFDWNLDYDWRVNSSASSLAAFRNVVTSPLYQGSVS